MTTPISIASAEHYTWGDGCDGWHLVRAAGLSVIEERMPPGAMEHRHRHAAARQLFYVVEGELVMEVEGVVHVLGAQRGGGRRPLPRRVAAAEPRRSHAGVTIRPGAAQAERRYFATQQAGLRAM